MTPPRVAIVDPYSSGALLAPAFAERGHECIAVLSSREAPGIFASSFRPGDFTAVLPAAASIAETASRLGRRRVGHVLAGSEPGVELADELGFRLGLPTNGLRLRSARRDKSLMAAAVAGRGLRTPAQLCSPSLEDVKAWARSRATWPLVVKPPKSVASDTVSVCRNDAELERAFTSVLKRLNILGLVNESVLVQEFVRGPEFVVDTVSQGGRHRVAAFWRYHRPPRGRRRGAFYGAMELLPYAGKRQSDLLAYTTRVLDALEIRQGPAHTELIWRDGAGPVLVETGARLSAGNNAVLSRLCGGPCALDLTVEAIVDPEHFLAADQPSRMTGTAINCFLIPTADHRLRPRPPLAEIRRLPSFHSMSISRPPRCRPVIGVVTLVHRSRSVALRDLQRVRQLERTRLYESVPAAVRKQPVHA